MEKELRNEVFNKIVDSVMSQLLKTFFRNQLKHFHLKEDIILNQHVRENVEYKVGNGLNNVDSVIFEKIVRFEFADE